MAKNNKNKYKKTKMPSNPYLYDIGYSYENVKFRWVQIFESENYPTPSTKFEMMIRNYKGYFYN